MSIKSVIEIDVDDKAFKAFNALYQKYQTQLKGMPKVWSEVSKQIDGSKKTFQGLIAGLIVERFHQQAILKAQQEVDKLTRSTAESWANIGRHSSRFVGILNTVGRLTKDLGILGLVGAGSIFGLDRLASGVGAGRKHAQSLDLSYGQLRAFQLNYEWYLPGGSDAFLGAVSEARGTAVGKQALYGAGLTQRDLKGNTADTAVALIGSLKKLFDPANPNLLGDTAIARRLEQLGIGVDYARISRATSTGELSGSASGYRKDARSLDLSDKVLRQFQNFDIQLRRAGLSIETAFIKGINPLIPQLDKLSNAFGLVVTKLLGSDAFSHAIDAVTKGLEIFADFVGTPQFEQNVKTVASTMAGFAKWAGSIAGLVGTAPKNAETGGILGEKEGHDTWNEIVRNSRHTRAALGLDLDLNTRLGKMLRAVPGEMGPVRLTSGFRTHEEQEALRRYNPSGYPVAQGISEHEKGLAADVSGNPRALAWMHAHAREFGLEFPVRGDPVHVRKMQEPVAPTTIVVRVQNETGANVTVTGNQVARGQ